MPPESTLRALAIGAAVVLGVVAVIWAAGIALYLGGGESGPGEDVDAPRIVIEVEPAIVRAGSDA